ncbi:MAG: hypothetical protein AAF525_12250 [Pseudomonadota bacterium]
MGATTISILLIIVNLLIGRPLIPYWYMLVAQSDTRNWRFLILAFRIILPTLAWFILMMMSISTLVDAMGTGPAPYILLPWGLFGMVYGICYLLLPARDTQQQDKDDHQVR